MRAFTTNPATNPNPGKPMFKYCAIAFTAYVAPAEIAAPLISP